MPPAAGTFFLPAEERPPPREPPAVVPPAIVLPPVLVDAVELAGAGGVPAAGAPVAGDGWFGVWGGMTTGVLPAEEIGLLGAPLLEGGTGGAVGGGVDVAVELPPAEPGKGGGVADPPPLEEGVGEVGGWLPAFDCGALFFWAVWG